MNQTAEEVLKFVEDEDVKFIRLAFRDAYGVQKNISVMPGEVVKAFEEGIPINARQVAGFRDCPHASLYLKPETDTMAILPWRPDSGRVLRLFCDLLTPDGVPYESDTRAIMRLRQPEKRASPLNSAMLPNSTFLQRMMKEDRPKRPMTTPVTWISRPLTSAKT